MGYVKVGGSLVPPLPLLLNRTPKGGDVEMIHRKKIKVLRDAHGYDNVIENLVEEVFSIRASLHHQLDHQVDMDNRLRFMEYMFKKTEKP